MPKHKKPILKFANGTGTEIPSKLTQENFEEIFLEIVDSNLENDDEWGRDFYTDGEKYSNRGKWEINFKKGSPEVDSAWEKVIQGVKDGVFLEAKVSRVNPDYEDQTIIIYTYDSRNKNDVAWVLNEIEKRGIAKDAISDLKYITDKATKAAKGAKHTPPMYVFSVNAVIFELNNRVTQFIDEIKNKVPELNPESQQDELIEANKLIDKLTKAGAFVLKELASANSMQDRKKVINTFRSTCEETITQLEKNLIWDQKIETLWMDVKNFFIELGNKWFGQNDPLLEPSEKVLINKVKDMKSSLNVIKDEEDLLEDKSKLKSI